MYPIFTENNSKTGYIHTIGNYLLIRWMGAQPEYRSLLPLNSLE